MQTIKEATGVSDIQEVVQRFLSQSATHDHLETWKHTNEKSLQRLKEEEELLQNEFEQVRIENNFASIVTSYLSHPEILIPY